MGKPPHRERGGWGTCPEWVHLVDVSRPPPLLLPFRAAVRKGEEVERVARISRLLLITN